MSRYLHQIVFCSDRKGRAYRREITITGTSAMVTNVEILPPYYEIPIERMRGESEEVWQYEGSLSYFSEYRGCPFCGARKVFICDCGYLSCRNVDARPIHTCPKCDGIFNTKTAESLPMSKSGLVHQPGLLPPGQGRREVPREPGRRLLEGPDPAKEKRLAKLQEYLERKALEDKRDKD